MRNSRFPFPFLFLALGTVALIVIFLKPREQPIPMANSMFTRWRQCFTEKTQSLRGDPEKSWKSIGEMVRSCEEPYVKLLKILDFNNQDETKYHILPVKKTTQKSIIITVGIGHDTNAEELLLKKMGNETVEFYGADPMVEINEGLYSKFGNFFPFAIGATSGISKASVLNNETYKDKLVVHVDAIYFLKNLVGKTLIDDIWLDSEGAEYDMFPYFYKGGAFDQNAISFCQVNMEIHLPDAKMKQQIHDFLFHILDDQRYAVFRPVQGNHMRLFFFNFEDQRCVDRYVGTYNATNIKV